MSWSRAGTGLLRPRCTIIRPAEWCRWSVIQYTVHHQEEMEVGWIVVRDESLISMVTHSAISFLGGSAPLSGEFQAKPEIDWRSPEIGICCNLNSSSSLHARSTFHQAEIANMHHDVQPHLIRPLNTHVTTRQPTTRQLAPTLDANSGT